MNEAPDPKAVLAARMKSVREAAEKTQAECGKRLGVTQTSISRFEGGEALPSVDLLKRWCVLLGQDVDEVLALLEDAKLAAAKDQIRRQVDAARE